jgi:hypothetical protein
MVGYQVDSINLGTFPILSGGQIIRVQTYRQFLWKIFLCQIIHGQRKNRMEKARVLRGWSSQFSWRKISSQMVRGQSCLLVFWKKNWRSTGQRINVSPSFHEEKSKWFNGQLGWGQTYWNWLGCNGCCKFHPEQNLKSYLRLWLWFLYMGIIFEELFARIYVF